MEAFLLKYPRHSWSCKELKMLLKSKLSGKAKAQYEALPREIRHGSFEGIMAALSRANKEDDQTKKKLETQTIAEYCVELERLSAKAYPELDEVTLSTVRAHQLYEQVVHWPESYYFMEAMEKDGGTAYASLKQAAMRVERRRLTLGKCEGATFVRKPAVKRKRLGTHVMKLGRWNSDNCKGRGTSPKTLKRKRCGMWSWGPHGGHVNDESLRARESEGTAAKPYGEKCITKVDVCAKALVALLDTGSEYQFCP
ncbi:hypothetical protein COOONC_25563 [Cooperia oncophora]